MGTQIRLTASFQKTQYRLEGNEISFSVCRNEVSTRYSAKPYFKNKRKWRYVHMKKKNTIAKVKSQWKNGIFQKRK